MFFYYRIFTGIGTITVESFLSKNNGQVRLGTLDNPHIMQRRTGAVVAGELELLLPGAISCLVAETINLLKNEYRLYRAVLLILSVIFIFAFD